MRTPTGTRSVNVHAARRSAPRVVCALLVAVAGCGDGGETAGDGSAETVAQAPMPRAPAEPEVDRSPPLFGGIVRVELLGAGTYRVGWEPASDGGSLAGTIEYQVLHVAEPWREPSDDDSPVAASLPGATDVELDLDAPGGRFFVRAVDRAGNRSAWGPGLEQRSRRPWLRAPDGGPLAEIRDCAALDGGRGVCVGPNGFAARWDRERWAPTPASDGADLRIATTSAEPHLFSPAGHLYRLESEGMITPFSIRFTGAAPQLPLRQFTRDHVGLAYWLDAAGTMYISGGGAFRPVDFVLGLPDRTQCGPLRGLGFSPAALFAFCETGSVYSVSTAGTELMWLPLTSQTPFAIPAGLDGLLASDDASAVVVTDNAVRRVGVGGWTDLLVPGQVTSGGLAPSRVGRVETIGGRLHVSTDLGVLVQEGERWDLVPGSQGDAVGVFGPSPLEPPDQLTVVYADGSVARIRASRRSWVVEPPVSGFVLAGRSADGAVLALARGTGAGIWAWQAGRWRQLTTSAPAPATGLFVPTALTGHIGSGFVLLGGTLDDAGVIYELNGGTWSAAPALYPPPAAPPQEPAAPGAFDFAEEDLAAPAVVGELTGVAAAALPTAPAPMGRVVAMEVTTDGRAIAVTEGQVWWRTRAGWLLLTERIDGNLRGVAIDAGESYVLVEGDRVARCWRDLCDLGVAPAAEAPGGVVSAWRDGGGLVVLTASGSLHRFVRAALPDGVRRPASNENTPAGRFESIGTLPAPIGDNDVVQALVGDQSAALWSRDGAVSEVVDGDWLRQARDDDALMLIESDGHWALLTSRGLLRLGDVSVAARDTEGP